MKLDNYLIKEVEGCKRGKDSAESGLRKWRKKGSSLWLEKLSKSAFGQHHLHENRCLILRNHIFRPLEHVREDNRFRFRADNGKMTTPLYLNSRKEKFP